MHLGNSWRAVGRVTAAVMLGAATRFATPRSHEPAERYATDIQMYDDGPRNVFVDYPTGYADLPALTSAADLIVKGRVVRFSPADEHATLVTLTVDRTFKGETRDNVGILYPAGKGESIAGDPPFTRDVTYVVFLRRSAAATYDVLGGAAGRFVSEHGEISALSVVYGDSGIFDTGIRHVPVDRIGWLLGNADMGPGGTAVMPGEESRLRNE